MAYSLGKSPINNSWQLLKSSRLIMIEHEAYLWNDLNEIGVTVVDKIKPGDIVIVLFVGIEKYADDSYDCFVFNQNGKFGWCLIDITSIIYLDCEL